MERNVPAVDLAREHGVPFLGKTALVSAPGTRTRNDVGYGRKS